MSNMHASDTFDVTDTGPLEWRPARAPRLMTLATGTLAGSLVTISLMFTAYATAGHP